ncbi:F0F1 ATP synthase subunit gamma [Dysgonomonas sp. 25]|uniref:F0F1 ATP synthase subunit gamma n=1 Tax=Dysgonomonas sp. 25 TaxID=2302933 RepID=UPI0013CFA3D1|nr:F0F1 ATP synthase subunit gamma [Dysgonomonas sp. 25]NDV68230.1 F0F1 ATP synthase subunit gamma [Dysgonomonas sp. 25]
MASLKEIKGRINSVRSTRKITSAMKMIASAKLRKAQTAITNFLPYQEKLDAILNRLLSSDTSYDSPFIAKREVKRVGIVAFSSNSSMCGGFNSNIIKEFRATYTKYENLGKENILIYPVGKKIADAVKKLQLTAQGDYIGMADAPSYEEVQELAKDLITKFAGEEVDEIVLIYFHFKSTGSQLLMNKVYLPFEFASEDEVAEKDSGYQPDYIYEPSKKEILDSLIPNVLYSRLFAALLDSNASEHAARVMAMQIATDNANDLLYDLGIQYNKTRQQAVTNELLDIIGGASALQG